VLVIHPSLPVHSVAEFDRLRQGQSDKVNYAFVPGTVGHIATELFAKTAASGSPKIPYKGNGDALGNLIGGHVSMMVLAIVPIIGNVRRDLAGAAVTSGERFGAAARRAPIADSGLPGFSAVIR